MAIQDEIKLSNHRAWGYSNIIYDVPKRVERYAEPQDWRHMGEGEWIW